jgi:hypothetical protein
MSLRSARDGGEVPRLRWEADPRRLDHFTLSDLARLREVLGGGGAYEPGKASPDGEEVVEALNP